MPQTLGLDTAKRYSCDLNLRQEAGGTCLNPLGLTPPSHPCDVDSKARASTPWSLTPTNDPSDLNEKSVKADASTPWA